MKKLLCISLIVINLSCYASSSQTSENESLANQIQRVMTRPFSSADEWAVRCPTQTKVEETLKVLNKALDGMGNTLGVAPKAMQPMKDSTVKIVQNRADTKGRISKSDVQAVVKSVKYALVTPCKNAIRAGAIAVGASAGTVGGAVVGVGATIGKTKRKVTTLYKYGSDNDNESKLKEAALFVPRLVNIVAVEGLRGVYDTVILAGQGGIVGAKTADQIIIERITGGTNVVDSVESAVKDIKEYKKSLFTKSSVKPTKSVLEIDGVSSLHNPNSDQNKELPSEQATNDQDAQQQKEAREIAVQEQKQAQEQREQAQEQREQARL